MKSPTLTDATRAIDRNGVLLVYPVQNKPEPLSLWHVLYPRVQMRWDWSDDADERVVGLWHLRERLARSKRVVYTKWLGDRATFFSRVLFAGMLGALGERREAGISPAARTLLEIVRDDSPKPTRRLREAADLAGREHDGAFARGMRELWSRLLIVGVGESDEGGFPSLSVAATELMFESLQAEASSKPAAAALERALREHPSFRRAWSKLLRASSAPAEIEP